MKTLSSWLIAIGVIILIGSPIYTQLYSNYYNVPGDGVTEYDNPIFRNILGAKTTYATRESHGWEDDGTCTLYPPQWMQKTFGVKEKLYSGYNDRVEPSTDEGFYTVYFIRLLIKILLPGIPLLIGYLLSRKAVQ